MRLIFLALFFLFQNEILSQNLYFPPLLGDAWETLEMNEIGWCEENLDELFAQLEGGNTDAFMVLKDGKIVIEKYFGDFKQNDAHAWNSAGKTVTSFLIGIAHEENLLNINDKTSDYLGKNWTSLSPEKEELITIENQLSMTSGLDDSGDPFCTDPVCLTYLADAGTRWAYHNGPYTILDRVIESASGETFADFLRTRLKLKIGLGGQFIKIGDNNVFFSKARNMARFGLLILNKGTWDNTPVLTDQNYLNQMITASQNLNKGYGYLWWLNDTDSYKLPGSQIDFSGNPTPNAPREMYSGIGKSGQFLDIIPSQNLIVIRMGDSPDSALVPLIFHDEMWAKLNDVICPTSNTTAVETKTDFEVFPNPFQSEINFDKSVFSLSISNALGEKVFQSENVEKLNLDFLPKGIYFLEMKTKKGEKSSAKIIKN